MRWVKQNDPCMMNLWIHDGSKEVPASRLRYRRILEESLDEIFATEYKWMKDCIEAKLFGIGLESYTVGPMISIWVTGRKRTRSLPWTLAISI